MKNRLRMAGFWFVLGTVCIGLAQGLWAQSSSAGCGYFQRQKTITPSLKPASLQLVSGSDSDRASIVGLWKFTFVSEGNPGIPDGTVIDAGYAAWHSDGTEIINSGAHAPITGSFCMGVWKQTKHSTFKLNHFALPWDPTGTFFVGPANLKEEVVLDRSKNSYSGTFTIDQYDTNGNLLAHIAGTTSAQRVTVD